jgi:hypothetical protein
MPMHPIDEHWRRRIFEDHARNPAESAEAMARGFQMETEGYVPSARTIRRYFKEFDDLPEGVQRDYLDAHWPESFGTPELPWTAAPSLFELVRYHGNSNMPARLVKWFHRVTAAIPNVDIYVRDRVARQLALWDSAGGISRDEARSVELFFAIGAWEPGEAYNVYRDTCGKLGIKPFELSIVSRNIRGLTGAELHERLANLSGADRRLFDGLTVLEKGDEHNE